MTLVLLHLLGCANPPAPPPPPPAATRLSWFIPDGLRADPETFDIFRWAEEGKLPHLHALMQRGTYGYSIPAFPSHTPANFATLLTGATPDVHGVGDGPMHVEGRPLARPSVGGFSASARKIPAIWSLLEGAGKKVFLLSVPGSTPPELGPGGVTVRGRWGGWGPELPAVTFEPVSPERKLEMARSARLFLVGEALTRFVDAPVVAAWPPAPPSDSPPRELDLTCSGAPLYGLLLDTPGDGREGYDHLVLSKDRTTIVGTLRPSEWSDWLPATTEWKGVEVATNQRVELIKLDPSGFFRVRVLFDGLNQVVVDPPAAADTLREATGPMVDFVDSYPAQLVHYPEDKPAFLEEARQSLDWHTRAVDAVATRFNPDVFIHNVYTPNQMLTSLWWMGAVDPKSARYATTPEAEREAAWRDVMWMYTQIDETLGRMAANAGPDTLIVLSSDHGAIPLDRWVRVNNLFAERGWLAVTTDPETGAPEVDWEHSKVVFLNTYHVYVNPDGLGGDWRRGTGPAYEALRSEVIAALDEVRDGEIDPIARITRWEDAEAELHLPTDRVGDLLLTSRPGYAWNEQLTVDRALFGDTKVAGYKQAVSADTTPGLWTPFVIVGPGVTPGRRLDQPVRAIDQLPTILRAMGQPIPETVRGRVLDEVFAPPG
jgi:predicted AlkP superfamily phosphohydrolase/phosphomutase